jgi:BirA family biotin operon repressor/biotin-[acetyl-CoA-carboxylase] ligase
VLTLSANRLLAKEVFSQLLPDCIDGLSVIEVFDEIPSTQQAIQSRTVGGREWIACIALAQRAGFGRQGRVWQSARGQVAMSWRGWVSVSSASIGLVSLAAALAVADALESLQIDAVRFKWPNDIYWHEKKLAGILVSICQLKENRLDAVLGIGLNRLHLSLPEQAIALADIIPHPPTLSAVLAELLMAWHRWRDVLSSEAGRNHIVASWLERALWINSPVRVLLHKGYMDGVFVGITSSGLLRIATDAGEKIFAAGEVQLRPLD